MIIDTEYFRNLLQAFLNTNVPDLSNDKKLISWRAEAANEVYHRFVDQDKTAALEMAKIRLFEGLEFSVYYFVLDIVCRYYNRIPDKTQQEICEAILPRCIKIYNRLSFSSNIGNAYYCMVAAIQEIIKDYHDKNEL